MEFVPGQCLDIVDFDQHPDLMERIAASLKYLWQIPPPHDQQAAGLLGDGLPQGYIFVDDGCDVVFNTITEMGDWMDDRLAFQKLRLEAIPKARIDGREMLKDYKRGSGFHWSKFVMCYLDIAPRNLILLRDGFSCFLDWTFAWFYHSIFAVYALDARAELSEKHLKSLLGHVHTADSISERQLQVLSAVHYPNDSMTS